MSRCCRNPPCSQSGSPLPARVQTTSRAGFREPARFPWRQPGSGRRGSFRNARARGSRGGPGRRDPGGISGLSGSAQARAGSLSAGPDGRPDREIQAALAARTGTGADDQAAVAVEDDGDLDGWPRLSRIPARSRAKNPRTPVGSRPAIRECLGRVGARGPVRAGHPSRCCCAQVYGG